MGCVENISILLVAAATKAVTIHHAGETSINLNHLVMNNNEITVNNLHNNLFHFNIMEDSVGGKDNNSMTMNKNSPNVNSMNKNSPPSSPRGLTSSNKNNNIPGANGQGNRAAKFSTNDVLFMHICIAVRLIWEASLQVLRTQVIECQEAVQFFGFGMFYPDGGFYPPETTSTSTASSSSSSSASQSTSVSSSSSFSGSGSGSLSGSSHKEAIPTTTTAWFFFIKSKISWGFFQKK